MKPFFKNILYALFSLVLLVACNEAADINNQNKQLEELKAAQIASVNTQMTNIQNSIKDLEKVDTGLNSLISTLQASLEEIDGAVEGMEKTIGRLEGADATLKQRIKDLKAYCEDVSNSVKEWTTTTYATLQKHNAVLTEISGLKDNLLSELMLSVSALNTSYSKKIASDRAKVISEIEGLETSLKGWVNEQLTGYYTIAQVDAKLKALEDGYKAGDESLSSEITTLRQNIETAKTDLTTAYNAAISAAITENNGTINQKIADDIKAATDALQKQINDLSDRLDVVEGRLTALEASVAKLINMVQSIVVVPDYSDGSVMLSKVANNQVRFEVYPLEAAAVIAEAGPSILSLDYVETQTKSSEDFVNLPITAVSFTGKTLLLTIDGTGLPEAILTGSSSANARLKISDGTNTRTSEYFPIYKQGGDSNPQTGVAITGECADVRESSAKLYGWCNQTGVEGASVVYGIEYSSTDLTTSAIILRAEEKDSDNKYYCMASGLNVNTQYYYRAFTLFNGVRTYGQVKTFKTTDFSATVTTLSASDITEFKANLNGALSVVSEEELSKTVWFLYSDTATTLDALKSTGKESTYATLAEDGSFQCLIPQQSSYYDSDRLNYNTTYYYVACSNVQGREVYGDVKTFKTSDFSATISCYSENVDKTTATVSGALAVASKETLSQSVTLYYGTKNSSVDDLMSNGQRVSVSLKQDGSFSYNISSLINGTKYYYVAVANVYDKVFNSTVKSFTTLTPNCPSGAVNLGLSVCWATCNVGASSPEQKGNLYAWGETEPKTSFGWANYKWANGTFKTLTKYNWDSKYGVVDNLMTLELSDDAAHVALGSSWRTPTKEEYQELFTNCKYEFYVMNGVTGVLVTSKLEGYTSNYIFIPGTNNDFGTSWSEGRYWTASLKDTGHHGTPDFAELFSFHGSGKYDAFDEWQSSMDYSLGSSGATDSGTGRSSGHCVRGVID